MNKNLIKILSVLCIMLIVTSCNDNNESTKDNTNKVSETKQQLKNNVPNVVPNGSNIKKENKTQVKNVTPVSVDLDLTRLSSTMVYSEVSQMMSNPSKYVGKKVKMNGQVTIYKSEEMNRTYYTCIIADATACCQQGIEFRLEKNAELPKNYKEGDEVTVIGEFSTYLEGSNIYCELVNSKLV